MQKQWYYADRQREQQGPVDQSALVEAFRRGDIDMTTLVWNESLPSWVPFAQVAQQLGVAGAPPAMPRNTPAPRRAPPPPSNSGKKIVLIVLAVVVGIVVLFGGILAAIAIPAYNDYTVRARVAQAYVPLSVQRVAVAEFRMTNDRCPRNGDEGFGPPESYAGTYVSAIEFTTSGDSCVINGVLHNLGASRYDGEVMTLQMDGNQRWSGSSTLPPKIWPASLRR